MMRKVADFGEFEHEFKNYLERGTATTRFIVYFTDDEAMKTLSSYHRKGIINKPPEEYIQHLVKKSCLLLPKSKKPVFETERGMKREDFVRLYFMGGNRYAYCDVYNERKSNISKKVRLRKLLLKLPKMPLREYLSHMKEIWNTTGDMNITVETLYLEYMGLGDTVKIVPLIGTGHLELRTKPDDIIFQ